MASDPDSTHVFVVDDVHTLDNVRDDLYLSVCDVIGTKVREFELKFTIENP